MIGFALETQRPLLNNWCALCSRWTGEERENRERAPDNQTEIDRKACRFLTGSSLPFGKIPFSLCNEKTTMRARSQVLVSHVAVGVHAGELQAGVCASTEHDRVVTTNCVWPSSLSPTQTLTQRVRVGLIISRRRADLLEAQCSCQSFSGLMWAWRQCGSSRLHGESLPLCRLLRVFVLYAAVNHWMGERFFQCIRGSVRRADLWGNERGNFCEWGVGVGVMAVPLLFVYLESRLHLMCFYSTVWV